MSLITQKLNRRSINATKQYYNTNQKFVRLNFPILVSFLLNFVSEGYQYQQNSLCHVCGRVNEPQNLFVIREGHGVKLLIHSKNDTRQLPITIAKFSPSFSIFRWLFIYNRNAKLSQQRIFLTMILLGVRTVRDATTIRRCVVIQYEIIV